MDGKRATFAAPAIYDMLIHIAPFFGVEDDTGEFAVADPHSLKATVNPYRN